MPLTNSDKAVIQKMMDDSLSKFQKKNLAFRSKRSYASVLDKNSPITGASTQIGFYSAPKVAKQTITGSKGANAALTSLMAGLVAIGLFTDSTT